MGILFLRAVFWPSKYAYPNFGSAHALVILLVFLWCSVAVFITSKFIKSLKAIERSDDLKDALDAVLASTKLIRGSMIGLLLVFAVLVVVFLNPGDMPERLNEILGKLCTLVGFATIIFPFRKATLTSFLFKESQNSSIKKQEESLEEIEN